MKIELLKRHDPRRKEAEGLVRRTIRAGKLTKKRSDAFTAELGEATVSRITAEEKAAAGATKGTDSKK